ncbi:MAG TPA: chloride channel protein [Gemmatimonadaceae bacterium]|nr:chloride channel protein [Gemmatimonadaceae bacterium]
MSSSEAPTAHDSEVEPENTVTGLPVAPALEPALEAIHLPQQGQTVQSNRRIVLISAIAILVGFAAGVIAKLLILLIDFITNVSFFGQFTTGFHSPSGTHIGLWIIVIPAIGGIIVGYMARYGSAAIRGHGIPEAMEQVIYNESRVPARVTLLKPISSAIAIGTGGPFGAEGPIIATGGAFGSLIGQFLRITGDERKILLSAGAAGGMTAIFGTPVSGVLLAIELLLFEYRARSLVPVALASATAMAVHVWLFGTEPVFPMPNITEPSGSALAVYTFLGALVGFASVYITRAVYVIEDAFDRIPVHWMWWPAIGGLAVGIIGYFDPRTLGVGYDNIQHILSGHVLGMSLVALVVLKFVSWAIALGSGTSGGTLAPLFTMGGGIGALLGVGANAIAPNLGIDPRIAALVGMAAVFAGASRALLTSIVFAFEATRQPLGLLPLLGGGTAAYLVSLLMMRSTIMTEKLVRRGTRIPSEYEADFLDQVLVRDVQSSDVVALKADDAVEEVRDWMAARAPGSGHQGFPVVNAKDQLVGVITRRDLLDTDLEMTCLVRELIKRPPVVVYEDNSLREAADQMVREGVGRLPVVSREDPRHVAGLITRSDLLAAHERRLQLANRQQRSIVFGRLRGARAKPA